MQESHVGYCVFSTRGGQVGNATLEELHRQRAQINDITEEVLMIDDNLTRAEKVRSDL